MKSCDIENLLESEREWRRHVIEKLEKISDTQSTMHAWNLVFRIVGGGLFAVILTVLGALLARQ